MSKKRLRLTVHGTVNGEACSFGLSARGDDQWVSFDLFSANEYLSQADGPTQTFLNAIASYCGNAVSWTGMKVRQWNESGVLQVLAERQFAAPITSGAAQVLPGYCAVVVTTLTDTPGRRARGRMYLPYTAQTGLSAGKIGNAARDAICLAAKDWIANLNDAPGIDAIVGGYRAVVHSDVLGGEQYDITRVRVGNVLDAQRRRNNEQVETFSLLSV